MHTYFSPFPNLETENLILTELNLNDAEDFHVLRSDPRIMKYIPRPRAVKIEDSIAVIQNTMDLLPEGNNITWSIRMKGNKTVIGTIGFYRIQWENLRGEVGYILHPDFQGKGIMSETLQRILDFGFQILKFHTIEAVIDPENKPSEKILLRNGFIQEGYFKENFCFEGKFYDSVVFTKFKS